MGYKSPQDSSFSFQNNVNSELLIFITVWSKSEIFHGQSVKLTCCSVICLDNEKCSQVKICTNVFKTGLICLCCGCRLQVTVSLQVSILQICRKVFLACRKSTGMAQYSSKHHKLQEIINNMFLQDLYLLGSCLCLTELLPWYGILIWDVHGPHICILAYVVRNKT